MLICLSSGFRPQYRDDVLRAISKPMGVDLQFRYEKKYVDKPVVGQLKENKLYGQEALICYLDRSDKSKPQEIIPCRIGTIIKSKVHGNFCTIVFRLSDFAYSGNLTQFNSELRSDVNGLSYWNFDNETDGLLCKCFFRYPLAMRRSRDDEYWQSIVSQLVGRKDFQNERFFYHNAGVQTRDEAPVGLVNGAYEVKSGVTYEAKLLIYDPRTEKGGSHESLSELHVRSGGKLIELTSNSEMAIDSPYDEKRVRFRVGRVPIKSNSFLSFYKVNASAEESRKDSSIFDYDIDMNIKGQVYKNFIVGSVIGLFLAAQALVVLDANSAQIELITKESSPPGLLSVVSIIILGWTAGLIASFNLQKP